MKAIYNKIYLIYFYLILIVISSISIKYLTTFSYYLTPYTRILNFIGGIAFAFSPWLYAALISVLFIRIHKYIRVSLYTILIFVYTILLCVFIYGLSVSAALDFNYFWYNRYESFDTIRALFLSAPLMITVVLIIYILFIIVGYYMFTKMFRFGLWIRTEESVLKLLSIILVLVGIVFLLSDNKHLVWYRDVNQTENRIAQNYYSYYHAQIEENINRDINFQEIHEENQPNLIMLQLESVNGLVADSETMPNFSDEFTKNGVYFPLVQGGAIQTIRAQEIVLCSVPPALGQTISRSDIVFEDLNCLPKILKELGYETHYFQGYDLEFYNIGEFAKGIGFDEVHSDDILEDGDINSPWGYRDDIYSQRVMEYLDRKYENSDQKYFAYIVLGSVNHYPFVVPIELLEKYEIDTQNKRNNKMKSRFKDYTVTLEIQDKIFSEIANWSKQDSNTLLFAFGDHSWPTGDHNSPYNQHGYWQEHFLTVAGLVGPKVADRFDNTVINEYISQSDFTPTILDLLGLGPQNMYGKTLMDSHRPSEKDNKCLLSIQPYSDSAISILNYPNKYLYFTKADKVIEYNLELDPTEITPVYQGVLNNKYKEIFDLCIVTHAIK